MQHNKARSRRNCYFEAWRPVFAPQNGVVQRSHRLKPSLEICLLAGGLSSRMGTDKARLCLGGRPLLQHIRQTARKLNVPVRILSTDIIPRCGPLGGVYTGLIRSRTQAVLFLPCDMPFVSSELLLKVVRALPKRGLAAFVVQPDCVWQRMDREHKHSSLDLQQTDNSSRCETFSGALAESVPLVGFPFVLKREALPVLKRLLNE